jgi:Tol biopolymer transport system component
MGTRQSTLWILAVALTGTLVQGMFALAQKQDPPDVLLQRAIQKEMVDGDLKGAIELYEKVVNVRGVTNRVAAEALVRMGQSYERIGSADAKKTYERVVREYASQTEAANEAKRRLDGLSKAQPSDRVRLVCSNCVGTQASIAQDGQIVQSDPETGDIAIRNTVTGRMDRLMVKTGSLKESPAVAGTPLLSPDQKYVAFTWNPATPGSIRELRVVQREAGAKPVALIANPDYVSFEPFAWTRDGKSVLVLTVKSDRTAQLIQISLADRALKVIRSLDWRAPSRGSLSPDGLYIAYSAFAQNPSNAPPALPDVTVRNIYVISADGSGPETVLVKGPNQNEAPIWTPDGKQILFVSDRSSPFGLWSIAVQDGRATGVPALVRQETRQIFPLGISRSGTYHYVQFRNRFEEIFLADLGKNGTRPPRPSTPTESALGMRPAWSPDGKLVAFGRQRPNSSVWDVIVRSDETGEEKVYSRAGFAAGYQTIWFHDSKSFLAWVGEGQGNNRSLYRVDVASKEWKLLQTLDTTRLAVATGLSADDKILYKGLRSANPSPAMVATPNDLFDGIVAIDIATGERRPIVKLPEPAFTFTLSPDGRTIIAVSSPDPKTQQSHLFRVGVDGSDYRVLPGSFRTTWVGSWTKDGRSFFFVQAKEGTTAINQIMRIATDGSGKAEFTGFELDRVSGFDMHPDNSRFAYSLTANANQTELWALDYTRDLSKSSK